MSKKEGYYLRHNQEITENDHPKGDLLEGKIFHGGVLKPV